MSTKLDALRKRLRKGHAGGEISGMMPTDSPVRVVHAHDDTYAYLRVEPPPANGILKMTPAEYEATIAEMGKVLVSLKRRIEERLQ